MCFTRPVPVPDPTSDPAVPTPPPGSSVDEREVAELFDAYEAALIANDVDTMNAMFWNDRRVLRFGIADMQEGFAELVEWRRHARPVSPRRTITARHVVSLAPGVVAVDITFHNGEAHELGRQSQTWVRTADGWRIARAHVSVIDPLAAP